RRRVVAFGQDSAHQRTTASGFDMPGIIRGCVSPGDTTTLWKSCVRRVGDSPRPGCTCGSETSLTRIKPGENSIKLAYPDFHPRLQLGKRSFCSSSRNTRAIHGARALRRLLRVCNPANAVAKRYLDCASRIAVANIGEANAGGRAAGSGEFAKDFAFQYVGRKSLAPAFAGTTNDGIDQRTLGACAIGFYP